MIKIMLRKTYTAMVRRLIYAEAKEKAYREETECLIDQNEALNQQLEEITRKYLKLTDRDEKGRFVK